MPRRSMTFLVVLFCALFATVAVGDPAALAASRRPPGTTLVRAPAGAVASSSASFAFRSNVAGAAFQCRLDGGHWRSCRSPKRFTGLSDGAHRFLVRAVAGGLVDPSPTTAAWVIDTTGPAVRLMAPANASTDVLSRPIYSGVAGTAARDLPKVTVRVYAGRTVSATPIQVLTTTASGSGRWGVATTSPLDDGVYTAVASQADSLGNTGRSRTTFRLHLRPIDHTRNRRLLAVSAHEDDDIIFMDPDMQNAIDEGNPERTVYVTAGQLAAGGSDVAYWKGREQGALAAHAVMGGKDISGIVPNGTGSANIHSLYTLSTIHLGGGYVEDVWTLKNTVPAGLVSVVFLRVPAADNPMEPTSDLWKSTSFSGVACPSSSRCTAVDSSGNEVTFDPASGKAVAPGLVDLEQDPTTHLPVNTANFALHAISCATTTQCTAVDDGGNEVTFDPTSGTVDQHGVVPLAPDPLRAVSCSSQTQCTAVDDAGNEVTFDPTTGTSNAAGVVSVAPSTALHGVSCTTTTRCTAVGDSGREVTFDPTSGLVNAAGVVSIDAGLPLASIACPSQTQCTAVDESGDEVTFAPGSGAANARGVVSIDGARALRSIACAAKTQCTAVDRTGREVTFDPTSGAVNAGGLVSIDAGNDLQAVTCTGVSTCTAVDAAGDQLTFDRGTGRLNSAGRTAIDALTTVGPVGGAARTYTRSDLIAMLGRIIGDYAPTDVLLQDGPDEWTYDNDDHIMAARFGLAGLQAYRTTHPLTRVSFYRGYNENGLERVNVTGDTMAEKQASLNAYCAFDTVFSDPNAPNFHTNCYATTWGNMEYASHGVPPGRGELRHAKNTCLTDQPQGPAVRGCTGAANQQWSYTSAGRLIGSSGRCLSGRGATARMSACATAAGWVLTDNGFLVSAESTLLGGPDDFGAGLHLKDYYERSRDPLGQFTNSQHAVANDGEDIPGAAAANLPASQSDYASNLRWTFRAAPARLVDGGSQFSDAGGWGTDASRYGSLHLADVNGDGLADACGRSSDGIVCALNDRHGRFLPATIWLSQDFTDAAGWNQDQYGSTIQFTDLNGDGAADVCGRGISGIVCALADPIHHRFVYQGLVTQNGNFSDAANWGSSSSYYASIHFADVDGDGYPDVCGRSSGGIVCALNTGDGQFGPAQDWFTGDYSDANGWNSPSYGSTVTFGDINGDGKADVCGRENSDVVCAVSTGSAFTDEHQWSFRSQFSNGQNWNADYYYNSIRLVDIDGDGRADICGRSATGLVCGRSNGYAFGVAMPAYGDGFSDATGWNASQYGTTVTFGRLRSGGSTLPAACGRGPAGIVCSSP